MQTKRLTCVICPRGCALEADVEHGAMLAVRGNSCKRGAAYAESELFHAERILTTTVAVDGQKQLLPVRTAAAIPREKVLECMALLKGVRACAPIAAHEVIVEDILGTGINVIASASSQAKE